MIQYANRVKDFGEKPDESKTGNHKTTETDRISLSSGDPVWIKPMEANPADTDFPEFREMISVKLNSENQFSVQAENILITSGPKHALHLAMQTLVNEGDEILVLSPAWEGYIEQIKQAGGIPRILSATEDDGFKVEPEEFERFVTSRIKGIILSSPGNPAGVTYTSEELHVIGDAAVKMGIFILADETFERFSYARPHKSIASLSQKYFEHTVTIGGYSKDYTNPDWTVGYIAAHEELITNLKGMMLHSKTSPDKTEINTCLPALQKTDVFYKKLSAEFKERRDYLCGALNSIHGVRCHVPEGGCFVFPNIQYYLAKSVGGEVPSSSVEFCRIVLEKAAVSSVPGSAFGMEGYVRFSFTESIEKLQEAVKRIRSILDK